MVNGRGATPLEELLIVYGRLSRLINERGARVIMPHIGEFATSMEMTGLSVSCLLYTSKPGQPGSGFFSCQEKRRKKQRQCPGWKKA